MDTSIDPRLIEAAQTGNIDALYALIQQDGRILEHIEHIPFVETPLHVAANQGQISFALEMMNLMPSFAKKLNQDGFSPMHLAVRNRQTELVLRFLKTDKDLVRVKGREKMTPFHCAVSMGYSIVLAKFLEACPECIEDMTVRDETALHLALKNDQIEAFTLLLAWLQKSLYANLFTIERKLVNWKDIDNNTVLHIAAIKEQHEAIKMLLDAQVWLAVRDTNSEGLTALEIIQKVEGQGMNINMSGKNEADIKDLKVNVKISHLMKARIAGTRAKNSLSIDMINTMLVIMALVITATYQSALSPPGGVWQDEGGNSSTTNVASGISTTNHFFPDYTKHVPFLKESRKIGTSIVNPLCYALFWVLNFFLLWSSIQFTAFLLSGFRLFIYTVIPLYFLVTSYFCSMTILAPTMAFSYFNLACTCLIGILAPLALHVYILYVSKPLKKEIKYRAEMRKVLDMDRDPKDAHTYAFQLLFNVI
ncbi:hypothetical protein F3Y22_tig00117056pilonHSYRG00010 [Hibiscus syriacus]|uniref:PGG domain-containing protein n=1 Tax=Hibiscus syriacus TaxID=106335 RepID=A0A6A2WV98_HIBSY|nr:ankyrin repeat-containing protein BDA1-like [Hibiscus syriacus]KAE8653686.1 hypothetical protein F3Y22_tig00117056pilonHSYRG00010 [Hibiscus syriacus]